MSTDTRPSQTHPWAERPEVAVEALASDAEKGLSDGQAKRRLEQHGPNRLDVARSRSRLAAFAMQFADWMIGLLAAAAAISAAVGEWPDALLIAAIVLANGVIGYFQEQKAEQAVAALKKLSQPTSRVWRNGGLAELPAEELVPGDIVELKAGDLVPADGRVLSIAELQTNESPLTGESMPVDKQGDPLDASTSLADRTNMVFAGTAVTRGVGKVVLTGTGMQTELGRIAELLESTEAAETPLQRRLGALSKRLAVAVIAVCVVVFTIGLLRGDTGPEEMFLVAVSLAVAAVPEGLPAVITIALALGSQRMSRRKAIVRQLSAVETLGSVNVICSDKTGTLTENRMSVREWIPHRDDPEIRQELMRAAVLCNDAKVSEQGDILGSPTETAIIVAAREQNIDSQKLLKEWPREREFPFNSARKRMSTIHRSPDGNKVVYVKGAAEVILELSTELAAKTGTLPFDVENRRKLERSLKDQTEQGRRVLAVARRELDNAELPHSHDAVEKDLAFIGFISIVDPPRPEARDALARCRSAGIRAVMITGDHQTTAVAIAKELSLWEEGAESIDGQTLERLNDDELRKHVPRTSVFARVSPKHKLRIVRAYQSLGNVVSMTGDGVNDAPALKQADIGVAMGIAGTDVSKEAARMVLADDNFATIVAAIEEGRVVYDNIRKFVLYLLSANLSEILLVLLAIVMGLPLPLLPVHLLWINLVTDGLPALALAYEPAETDLMRRPPRKRDESLFAQGVARDIAIFGGLMGVISLALYTYLIQFGDAVANPGQIEAYAQTAVFFSLAMSQLFYVLGLRCSDRSIIRSPPWQNWRLLGAFILGLVLQLATVYVPFLQPIFHTVPLKTVDLALALLCSATVLIIFELTKPLRRRPKSTAT